MKTKYGVWNMHDGYGEVSVVGRELSFPSSAYRLCPDLDHIPKPDHVVEVDIPLLMWGSEEEVAEDIREMVLAAV